MKSKLLPFLLLCFGCASAQIIYFPDANFKSKILNMSTEFQPQIDQNYDGEISVEEAAMVYTLDVTCSGCETAQKITSLEGIQYFTNLYYFYASHNLITQFNAANHPQIQFISLSHNALTSINVAWLSQLREIEISSNSLTYLDLNGLGALKRLICSSNELATLTIPSCPLEILNCSDNNLLSLDVSYITTLTVLSCTGNGMTDLQLPTTSPLWTINCGENSLTTLDVSAFVGLEELSLNDTNITTLDLSANPLLERLFFSDNAFEEVDLSFSENLQTLNCSSNQIAQFDLSNNPNLEYFVAGNNLLTEMDFSNNPLLKHVDVSENDLTTLDLSLQPELTTSYVNANPNLVTLFLKNGNSDFCGFYDNPSLQYVCADEDEVAEMQNYATSWGQTAQINSYCSFVPGGEFYTMTGNVTLDSNGNGCDAGDTAVSGTKFNITGANGVQYMTSSAATYSINLQQGSYTVSPILENPEYFSVSPASVTIDFPSQTSPMSQQFCLVPTGSHDDVEITIIPTTPAQPGFDSEYKIIYRNNGTEVSGGQIALEFDDAVMDMIQTSTMPNTQSPNNLIWNYASLLPFEVRTIDVVMNLNTPVETPALQGGETLVFTASIVPTATDQTSGDNQSVLSQAVVNSFDPNDKTCLEGTAVGTEVVGDYVHYTIRFENTGSAAAQNIVVKDVIDPAKYDIATLIPLHGSHGFETLISGNNVEFIFENIMLPFSPSPDRHGFVSFKIKLKASLVSGDSFSNTAGIYFDYNYPIITEPATTTIQSLATSSFDGQSVSIYPNPAKTVVNIMTDDMLEKAEVFDLSGRLLQHQLSIVNRQIDVRVLPRGVYLLKLYTADRTFISKMIKE